MTHRSRSGGPGPQQKGRKPLSKKKRGPKLHHPPPPPAAEDTTTPPPPADADGAESDSDDEEGSVLPARVFKDKPTNQGILNALDKAIRYDEHFPDHVQRAKALLFERRWLDLFLDRELLDAYAGRWVPSRALMFRAVMADLRPVRALFSPSEGSGEAGAEEDEEGEGEEGDGQKEDGAEGRDTGVTDTKNEPIREAEATGATDGHEVGERQAKKILSIGGGAGSELLAVAALCVPASASVEWVGVDIGDWGSVVERIAGAVEDWEIPSTFEFIEADVLKLPLSDAPKPPSKTAPSPSATDAQTEAPPAAPKPLPRWLQLQPDLTTIFFTLTELLSQSRPRTINFLRHLTASTPKGSHLLILDSASDIAEFPLGNSDRTWPVYMIIDALLLGLAVPKGTWRKVRAEDSRWFRLDGTERWGRCKLENGRYWLRLYERC